MTPLPASLLAGTPPPPGPCADLGAAMRALVPVLDTLRTRLRAPTLGDFPAWASLMDGPRSVHMGGPLSPEDAAYDFAACVATWTLRGHGAWAVEARDGALLGFVMVGFEPSDREPELGWMMLPEAEGQGLAHEAARAARDWARAMGLASLVSYVGPANARSLRLADRLGARPDPAAQAAFAGTDDADTVVMRHWGAPGGPA